MNDTKNSPPPSSLSPQGRAQRSGLGFSIALAGLMVVLLVAVAIGLPSLLKVVNPPSQITALSPNAADQVQQLAERRARQTAQLGSYGWVDKNAGIARIPIEEAITLIAAQGLPVGMPVAEVSAEISESSTTTETTPVVDLTNLTFQDNILPIFELHCGKCHGTDNPEEGLTLTNYKGMMNGSLNGGVIAKGDPDKSYLVEMVVSGKMPKRGGPLAQSDIDMIIAWIKAGAPEKGDGTSATVASTTPITDSAPITATSGLTATASVTPTASITSTASITGSESTTHTVDLANVSFSNDVLPIFMAHCSKCHGDDQPEEGLELTSYKKIMNGSLNGGVVKKGDPEGSYLVEMITSGKMPKRGDPLAQSDIDAIVAWIKAGAVDDSEIATGTPTATSQTIISPTVISPTVIAPTITITITTTPTVSLSASVTATLPRTATIANTATPKATTTPTKITTSNTPTPSPTATPTLSATEIPATSDAISATGRITESIALSTTESTTHTVDLANVSFSNDVLPIFMAHCSKCHGDDQPEEGLELTSYKKIMNGSLNGGVVKKGDPEGSYLVEMITSGKMPKRGGPLAQDDIDTIIAWIKTGAPDDTGNTTGDASPAPVGTSPTLTTSDSISVTGVITTADVPQSTDLALDASVDPTNISFVNDVFPIFKLYCFKCHADDFPEEGLELTSYEKAMSGSIYGKVIAPGDPEKSYLVEMLVQGKMPKRGGPLPQQKIDTIVGWIKAGALDN